MTARISILAVLAFSLLAIEAVYAGEKETTQEMKCPDNGSVWWWSLDSQGKKTLQGAKSCKKGDTVKTDLPIDKKGKAIAFVPQGQNPPDPILFEGFVVGTPGSLSLSDSLTSDIFARVGFDEFVLPLLGSLETDFFVGVDLTQYLLDSLAIPSYSVGQMISVVDGISNDLPGMIVGTSDIFFSPVTGWSTNDPFTGSIEVLSLIEVQVGIPEPQSILLVLAGFLGFSFVSRHASRLY